MKLSDKVKLELEEINGKMTYFNDLFGRLETAVGPAGTLFSLLIHYF